MANRNIFRAIHERKWLSIEYKNGKEEITKYWIGIIDINPVKKTMKVMAVSYTHLTLPTKLEV